MVRRATGGDRAAPGDREQGVTRYLTTEAAFCERERLDGLQGSDDAVIPPDLRGLIPIAQRFGIGDDVCRGLAIRKTRPTERRSVVEAVDRCAQRIEAWLAESGVPPYGREAACFFWLLEALEEMEPRRARPASASSGATADQ